MHPRPTCIRPIHAHSCPQTERVAQPCGAIPERFLPRDAVRHVTIANGGRDLDDL